MKRMKNISTFLYRILFLSCFFMPSFLFAQESEVEMADLMRSNGKIYVVVAVVSVILLVLMIVLIRIDRKLRSIEKNREG